MLGEYHGPPDLRLIGRYALARHRRDAIDRSYRMYVTEQLRLIPQMSYLTNGWGEVVGYVKRAPDKSADEIVDGVLARLGA